MCKREWASTAAAQQQYLEPLGTIPEPVGLHPRFAVGSGERQAGRAGRSGVTGLSREKGRRIQGKDREGTGSLASETTSQQLYTGQSVTRKQNLSGWPACKPERRANRHTSSICACTASAQQAKAARKKRDSGSSGSRLSTRLEAPRCGHTRDAAQRKRKGESTHHFLQEGGQHHLLSDPNALVLGHVLAAAGTLQLLHASPFCCSIQAGRSGRLGCGRF